MASEIQALPIYSARDLSPLYEAFAEEDDDNGDPIFLFSSFGYVTPEYTAYFGQSTSKKHHLTAEEIKKNLEPIPDDDVYPLAPTSGITTFSAVLSDDLYAKGPKLNSAFLGTGLLPKLLLQEAEVMERLSRNPHPNIIQYHGCITRRGRIVGLVFDRYDMTLKQQFDREMIRNFSVEGFMLQIQSATNHIHALGLAHNDITPMNIMVDSDNKQLILIDFGSCQPFGNPLITAGTPGWIDEDFCTSAKSHDVIALNKLRVWLERLKEEQRSASLAYADPVLHHMTSL